MRSRLAVVAVLLAAGCQRGPPEPAALDTRNDACARCRMAVSDPPFAAQLVSPSEEPRFFDDIGCLRDWLVANPGRPSRAIAYVADHRTKAWVRAAAAQYVRVPELYTPMNSHVIAHADAASRAADPDAEGGAPITSAEVFGSATVPDGSP